MPDYLDDIYTKTQYPIEIIEGDLKTKEKFLKNSLFKNIENHPHEYFDVILALHEALIKMSQLFLEENAFVSYDSIENQTFNTTNFLDDTLNSNGFVGVQIIVHGEVYTEEERKLSINYISKIIELRVRSLKSQQYVSSKPNEFFYNTLLKNSSNDFSTKMMIGQLNKYNFKEPSFNIAKKLLVCFNHNDILPTINSIAKSNTNDYDYDNLITQYIRHFLEFFYD